MSFQKAHDNKNTLKLILTCLFVYVVLFEFVLPINKVLPKPSMLFESFISIWGDYNLLSNLTNTVTAVYASLVASYFLIHIFAGKIIGLFVNLGISKKSADAVKYYPSFFVAVLFVFWLPQSFYSEIIFLFLTSIFILLNKLAKEINSVDKEQVLSAMSLGIGKSKIYSSVIWKNCQPALTSKTLKIHSYIWFMAMVFEFIDGGAGFGFVYKRMLEYNDFAGIFSVAILVTAIILTGNFLIKFIRSKTIFWESL